MTLDNKDLEVLKLRIQLLEEKLKNKDIELSKKEKELLALKEKLEEPDPLVDPNVETLTGDIQDILGELSPAELLILAKKKNIPIERIFPI